MRTEKNFRVSIPYRLATNKFITKIKIVVKSDYDVPLTLKVKLNWGKVKVEGSLNDEEYSGSFYLNVVPNKEIVIYRRFV